MSTLSEIEAALPNLSADELRQVAITLERLRVVRASGKPWMELAGCLSGEAAELHRIAEVVEDEFERVDPNDWQ